MASLGLSIIVIGLPLPWRRSIFIFGWELTTPYDCERGACHDKNQTYPISKKRRVLALKILLSDISAGQMTMGTPNDWKTVVRVYTTRPLFSVHGMRCLHWLFVNCKGLDNALMKSRSHHIQHRCYPRPGWIATSKSTISRYYVVAKLSLRWLTHSFFVVWLGLGQR